MNPTLTEERTGSDAALKIDQPTEAQYEIIYTTHFDLDLTMQNQETPLKNKAWLEVDWDPDGADGPLPEDKYGIPVIEKEHKAPTSVVEKKGSYDPATRYITWTVTLNKNLLSVKDGHILDTLTTTNQKFIGNPQIITPSTGYTIEMKEQADKGRTPRSSMRY